LQRKGAKVIKKAGRTEFKNALKQALVETLQEQPTLFHDVFAEVIEDFAMAQAIREGQETPLATRHEVDRALRGSR
jgi:hypothetical protein